MLVAWVRGKEWIGGEVALTLLLAALVTSWLTAKGSLASPGASSPAPPPPSTLALAATPPGTARDGPRMVETACNGLDDDGDQLVDVLLPVAANVCITAGRGACHEGYAACEAGQRVCIAAPASPEVEDGVDNDCNGVVDDVAPAANKIRGRALVLDPLYAQHESAADIGNVTSALAQAGIPFDRPKGDAAWTGALESLDVSAGNAPYALAVVPGYLMGSAVHGEVADTLRRFVERGGVLVIFKPIGSRDATGALDLAGLTRSARHRDVHTLRFETELPSAFAAVDSPEERVISINRPAPVALAARPSGDKTGDKLATKDAVEVYALEPDPAFGTRTVARGDTGTMTFPVITRRPLGKGAVYALGHDLATFAVSRCYTNCFEPSGDLLRLFLLGALREATSGHLVTLASAPNGAQSALLLLHDVDERDAQNAGAWGEPGALQMARMEEAHGVRATYAVTTDYSAGEYNPMTLTELCGLGMCPLGAHSVTHPAHFASLPRGSCAETRASYAVGRTSRSGRAGLSLCGEIAVSAAIIAGQTGRRPRLWSSPYLELPAQLFPLLVKEGFLFDVGFGIGDLPFNLPVDMSSLGAHQDRFRHAPLLELPVACEDALETDRDASTRVELGTTNGARFSSMWDYVALRNADNESFTTLLSHTARRSPELGSVAAKAQALATTLEDVARARGGRIATLPLEEIGDFWRARLGSSVDATYEDARGNGGLRAYVGDLSIGTSTTSGLTLELGDTIASFACPSCGPFRVEGKRVILTSAPAPRSRLHFVAKVASPALRPQ